VSEKISKEKAIELAKNFFGLSSEQQVYGAYSKSEDDIQYWWVTFAFPAEDRIYPKYDYVIVRINEATGTIERMPSI
jgi:hypothetical protein